MIYLNPMVKSGLGEDTFWTWFNREVKDSSFSIPQNFKEQDVVLHYSTVSNRSYDKAKKITLLWELLPEMKKTLVSNEWDSVINTTIENAKNSHFRVASTELTKEFYKDCGDIDVIPLGVDTDLFKPLENKIELRKKYNIPLNKTVGFWGGTTHRMKGFQNLVPFANNNPDIHWIIVWKQPHEASYFAGASNFTLVPQQTLCELMNCADFMLVCGLLKPFFMIEWEAMSCNLPMHNITGLEKDFIPSSSTRKDIFELGWDRHSVLNKWTNYLKRVNT